MNGFGETGQSPAAAYERWQALARSHHTSCVLDLVQNVAAHNRSSGILIRALGVVPIYIRLAEEKVPTSWAGGEQFIHVWSTPVRLTSGVEADATEISVTEVTLPALLSRLPTVVGVRVDPGLDSEIVVRPTMAQEIVAVAAGVPVPAALMPAEGEELRVEAGPTDLTDLDRRVRAALCAVDPEARVVRAAVTLVGIGGRVWPVYAITAASASPDDIARAVQGAARPVSAIVLVDGRPDDLATALAIDDVCLELSNR